MNSHYLELVTILGISAFSLLALRVLSKRAAKDVAVDLLEEEEEKLLSASNSASENESRIAKAVAAKGRLSFLSDKQKQKFRRKQILTPFVMAFTALSTLFFLHPEPAGLLVPVFVVSLAIGFLVTRRMEVNLANRYRRQLDFFLPIVMERLVMAVQAGLDVFAAMKAIVEIEKGNALNGELDPLTKLIQRACQLTERGILFEDALKEVSREVDCPALRHSFLHLSVAHKEGGELIAPLKELSDSTQLYYQETIEEEIAGLPVKATAPLLVTFVGLIIFFITPPMMQILKTMSSASFK